MNTERSREIKREVLSLNNTSRDRSIANTFLRIESDVGFLNKVSMGEITNVLES